MITYKKAEEIEILRIGGKILAQALEEVIKQVKPGVNISDLDKIAYDFLLKNGAKPSFLGYGASKRSMGFPSTLCISVNDEVVHGFGNRNLTLNSGDIVGLDIGAQYPAKNGLYTDMAKTVAVGEIDKEARRLLEVTEKSLYLAIEKVKPGNYIHDISKTIQQFCEDQGYSVVRDLSGHGVGYAVHEDPRIPDYYEPRFGQVELKEGMVICIEPMVCVGTYELVTDDDDWTTRTADGLLSAHFEHTIAVTKDGYKILTSL